MAGCVRVRNVSARSQCPCPADNDALRSLPRFIHLTVVRQLKYTPLAENTTLTR